MYDEGRVVEKALDPSDGMGADQRVHSPNRSPEGFRAAVDGVYISVFRGVDTCAALH